MESVGGYETLPTDTYKIILFIKNKKLTFLFCFILEYWFSHNFLHKNKNF